MRTTTIAITLLLLGCTTDFSTDDRDTTITDTFTPDTSTDTTPDTTPDVPTDTVTDPDTVTDTITDTHTDPDTATDPAVDTIEPTCDREGFEAVAVLAGRNDMVVLLQAISSDVEPSDLLTIEFYYGMGDPPPLTEPGTFVIGETEAEQNYQTCGTCSLIRTNCTAGECEKTFFATGGTLEIYDLGEAEGEAFGGTLWGATYVEITIDPESWISTPVPGGEGWCIEAFPFEEVFGPI